MTDAISKEKKKQLLKLFERAMTAKLDETDAGLKMFKMMRKAEKLDPSKITPAQEAKLEAKFNKLGESLEEVAKNAEQTVEKAKAKALAKGLTEEDVEQVYSVVSYGSDAFNDVFNRANLSKDLVKRMKEQDKQIVRFGEKPEYQKFYAK